MALVLEPGVGDYLIVHVGFASATWMRKQHAEHWRPTPTWQRQS
ncbi:MAG: HypC/HybG/HupF family hydrogenase formation chaperone [Nitrospira sp.]|nr:MAG: HypC/HybG/HupF family hydrogenase formation chaperone [Nitrospira sp.]